MAPVPTATCTCGAEVLRPDDESSFGGRLSRIRHRNGWGTPKEAALACGVPETNWRRWEYGRHTPRDYMNVARRIATAAGVDLRWLIGVDDDRPDRRTA